MKPTKIKIAFAEDIEDYRKSITKAVQQTNKFEVSFKATSGRDLILQLTRAIKLPQLILMDMQMPCCDGLLCTIICKWLFPNIKIVGFSSHTDGIVVGEFFSEGGDGFLSKLMLNNALAKQVYKDENIFENALNQIYSTNKGFIDIMLDDDGKKFKNRPSTKQLILKNGSFLNDVEIKYLQLNAAGFERKDIAEILNISEALVKSTVSTLYKKLSAETHTDLISIAVNLGIAKFLRIYQPPMVKIFDKI